jgi:hypothetical protein
LAVLLEEHPLQDLRPLEPPVQEVRRTVGEEEQDRAGLGEKPPVFGLQDRDPAVGIDLLEEPEVRVSPLARSYSTRSNGMPSCVRRRRTL